MTIRDHDTELWDEDWFLSLNDSEMLFWFYLKDRCDHAGFWRPNFKRFEQITGRRININDFIQKMNTDQKRILVLENGKWFLFGYIKFHFRGRLNLKNRFHKIVFDIFRKNVSCENTMEYGFEVFETSSTPLKEQSKENKESSLNSSLESSLKGGMQGGENSKEPCKPSKKRQKPAEFVPPMKDEVREYFKENGFPSDLADRFFNGYETAGWHDSRGNPVRCWKQKAIQVWFKPEWKTPVKKETDPRVIAAMEEMMYGRY